MKVSKRIIAAVVLIAVFTAFVVVAAQQGWFGPHNQIHPPNKQPFLALAMISQNLTVLDPDTLATANFTLPMTIPSAVYYGFASDGKYLYVGFSDPNEADPTRIWRVAYDGSVSALPITGNTEFRKLAYSRGSLYALLSDKADSSTVIEEINVTSFTVSRQIRPSVGGMPYTFLFSGSDLYLATFGPSSGSIAHLVNFDPVQVVDAHASSPILDLTASGDRVFARTSDAVISFAANLTYLSSAPAFGYGGIAIVGDKLAVAGYSTGGFPCVYWFNQNLVAAGNTTILANDSGMVFQIVSANGITYASMFESQKGVSVVEGIGGEPTMVLLPQTGNTWPLDFLYADWELPSA